MALSPDGKTLATTGADGLVKLWETTYPPPAVARQREIVRTATELVNARYRELSSHRDVMTSLLSDKSLEEDVLQMAVDISQARGGTQPDVVTRRDLCLVNALLFCFVDDQQDDVLQFLPVQHAAAMRRIHAAFSDFVMSVGFLVIFLVPVQVRPA